MSVKKTNINFLTGILNFCQTVGKNANKLFIGYFEMNVEKKFSMDASNILKLPVKKLHAWLWRVPHGDIVLIELTFEFDFSLRKF